MSNGLVLTLGHGSSAVLILNNTITNGYQNERITGVKSDSSFPKEAIEEISKFDRIPENIDIYVSHWNPDGDANKMDNKHYDDNYIKTNFNNSQIFQCNKKISHHDAHAHSIISYSDEVIENNSHIIVADGFGNFSEVISVYKIINGEPIKIESIYGYQNSLGLLYQYLTEFVGFRGNRDEWKLNAYSNKATENEQALADFYSVLFINKLKPKYDINLENLALFKTCIYDFFTDSCLPVTKSFISLFLQKVVQNTITTLMRKYSMKNVYLVGGCFLNVQLNGEILDKIEGKICVNPLSGDEGAGLGLYRFYNNEFKIPIDLCWGKRNLYKIENISNIMYVNADNLILNIYKYLELNYVVNVVRKNMEFGPRAYCNTSTLAQTSEENRNIINKMNKRHDVMPMCPVMTEQTAKRIFPKIDRVIKSHKHMVIALKSDIIIPGVYYKTLDGNFTYRPQVIDESHYLHGVCFSLGSLINTSFNNHGYPICYSMNDVIRTHKNMMKINKKLITLVETNGD